MQQRVLGLGAGFAAACGLTFGPGARLSRGFRRANAWPRAKRLKNIVIVAVGFMRDEIDDTEAG